MPLFIDSLGTNAKTSIFLMKHINAGLTEQLIIHMKAVLCSVACACVLHLLQIVPVRVTYLVRQ